jgi:hypothetical protein
MSAPWRQTGTCITLGLLWTSLSVQPAYPQTTYGAVVGTALDNSGSVVVGAKVTVTNQNTGETSSKLTNDVGAYSFPTLAAESELLNQTAAFYRVQFHRYPEAVDYLQQRGVRDPACCY